MSNWCDTTYKCVGEPNEIKALYNVLKSMEKRKTSLHPNDFGRMWLGNFVAKLGGNPKEVRCRGEITYYSLDCDILTICQNTAWCEQEGVRDTIEQTYPSIKVYYMEEECGCEVFRTNDGTGFYFPERYYLDSSDGSEYFEDIDDAAEYVSDLVGNEVEPSVTVINRALDEYVAANETENPDIYYIFYEFEVID